MLTKIGGINEEIENETEENGIRDIITGRNVSDSEENNDSSEETKIYESDGKDDIAELRQWAIKSQIQIHCHLNSLLLILRRRLISNLPAISKIFLKTKSTYQIKEFRSNNNTIIGEFIYFGIAAGLQRCVNKEVHLRNILNLQINCDGLPLYKSSTKQF